MKKTIYFEPLGIYLGFFLFCVFVPVVYFLLTGGPNSPLIADVILVIMAILTALGFGWGLGLASRQDCIVVTETHIIWHGLFRRACRINYSDCRYIGVETFNKEAQRQIYRGDECAAVYLSMDPFPEKFKGRINHLRCSDRIIKFYYTDALAEAILAVAPKEKAYLLRGFYNQMQNADRQRERERKNRRKQRKKK